MLHRVQSLRLMGQITCSCMPPDYKCQALRSDAMYIAHIPSYVHAFTHLYACSRYCVGLTTSTNIQSNPEVMARSTHSAVYCPSLGYTHHLPIQSESLPQFGRDYFVTFLIVLFFLVPDTPDDEPNLHPAPIAFGEKFTSTVSGTLPA